MSVVANVCGRAEMHHVLALRVINPPDCPHGDEINDGESCIWNFSPSYLNLWGLCRE